MVLKLKDVLHHSPNYNPLQAVEPHPLHSNKDSPLPFIERFTGKDFLSFWDGGEKGYMSPRKTPGNFTFIAATLTCLFRTLTGHQANMHMAQVPSDSTIGR